MADNKKLQIPNIKNGFSLIEMLVYVAIMTLIMVVVVNTLIVIIFTQRDIKNLRAIEQSGITALDRIVREIRDAKSVITAGADELSLNSTDNTGNAFIAEFSLEGEVLQLELKEDDSDPNSLISPLTDSRVRVTNLIFHDISDGQARTIKIEVTLEAGQGDYLRSENFYASATLR